MKADKETRKLKKLRKKKRKARKKQVRAIKKRIERAREREKRLRELLGRYGSDILHGKKFRESENYIQHGSMSVMRHSINVAKCSLRIAKRLGIRCNKRDLIRGALLHDYFQYDWHSREHRGLRNLHGFYHPGIAMRNAERDYRLNGRQRDIIKKHMWPLTVVPPVCREAWIVTAADKYCSLLETLHLQRGKKKVPARNKNGGGERIRR